MSRIRSVHPGLFTDEAFVTLSPAAQVFWIGLWCEADDQGIFEWKPLTLKMRLLPASPLMVEPLLEELVTAGCVRQFDMDGRWFGVIRNFAKHQRPKSPKDVHPLPDELRNYAGFNGDGSRPHATTGRKRFESSSEPVPNSFRSGSGIGSQMEDVGCRMEDVGKGELNPETPETYDCDAADATPRNPSRYHFEAGIIRLNKRDYDEWEASYPNLNLPGELRALQSWAKEQGKNWFFAVPGLLAKRDREARLAVERIKAEAIANANAPAPRKPVYLGP